MITEPPTDSFPFPTIDYSLSKLLTFAEDCIRANVGYEMGAKSPENIHVVPGTDFTVLDCSGFSKIAILIATDGSVVLDDGSVEQHEQCLRVGFKQSTIGDAASKDGHLRIAFLPPILDEPNGNVIEAGHVVLILNGVCLESHGHHGVDNLRPWNGLTWQARCSVFVLAL